MKDKSTSTVHDRIKHASLTIAGIGGADRINTANARLKKGERV